MSPELAARVDGVLAIALHRFLSMELIDPHDPAAGISLPVGDAALNNAGTLHGGIVAAMLDVASYLALLPRLAPDEHAVTSNLTTSLIRPVSAGRQLQVRASVLRQGRRVVHLRADATSGEEVVAAGQVTKSLVGTRP